MGAELKHCSLCGNVKCELGENGVLVVLDPRLRAGNYDVPFYCTECGAIKFPVKPTRDIVYVWPDRPKEKIGSIFIPNNQKKQYKSIFGKVLAIGPGYWKDGKFHPTELKVGDRVIFDNTVPHRVPMEGNDGKIYYIPFMGEQDIMCLVDEFEGPGACAVCGKESKESLCPYCFEEHDSATEDKS